MRGGPIPVALYVATADARWRGHPVVAWSLCRIPIIKRNGALRRRRARYFGLYRSLTDAARSVSAYEGKD